MDTFDKYLTVAGIAVTTGNGISAFNTVFPGAEMDFRCIDEQLDDAQVKYEDQQIISREDMNSTSIWKTSYTRLKYTTATSDCVSSWNNTCEKGMVWASGARYAEGQTSIYYTYNLSECDSQLIVKSTGSLYMVGLIAGNLFGAVLCDTFGRRPVHIVTQLAMAVCFASFPLLPNISSYNIVQVLIGAAAMMNFACYVTLSTELYSKKSKWLGGTSASIGYCVGYALIALVTYSFPAWPTQFWVYAVIQIITTVAAFYIPESASWLESKGRHDESLAVKKRIADINGTPVDVSEVLTDTKTSSADVGITDLIKEWTYFKHVIVLSVTVWPIITVMYYGFNLNTADMAGNPYMNTLFSAVVDVVAYFVAGYFCFIGVRKTMILSFSAMILASLGGLILRDFALHFSWFGKIAVTFAFNNVYILNAQIFPSYIRSSGVGVPNAVARLFGTLSPYVGMLQKSEPNTFWMVQTIVCSIGLLGLCTVPEVNEKKPVETLADMESQDETRIVKIDISCNLKNCLIKS